MKQEVILIALGALISMVTFLSNKIIDNWIMNKGSIRVYRKIIYRKNNNNETIGFYLSTEGMIFQVPLWLEIQNTKMNPYVIRDFSMFLCSEGKVVKKMKQISEEVFTKDENENHYYYGNQGSYSFILPPMSIEKYEVLYMLKKIEYPFEFDEVRVVYYDQRDRRIEGTIAHVTNSWTVQKYNIDEDWIKIG